MPIPVPRIDATGIWVPTYAEILAGFQEAYRGVYGSDVVLDADTQDGQWVAIQAAAYNDLCSVVLATYNAFSPSTAQGVGLSRVVKINGIARKVASNSTVDLLIGGTAGTVISNGSARDESGYLWALPETVTIPTAGQITVTATCQTIGDIEAPAESILTIATPTRGWQTVTNLTAAVTGDPVEADATLRKRQVASTELPSTTILRGLQGALLALSGVSVVQIYENDLPNTNDLGIPGHSICAVVEGGDAAAIADVIARKKTPGTGTFGTTSEVVTLSDGFSQSIQFQRQSPVEISIVIDLTALTGYTSSIGEQIQASVADFINGLGGGGDVFLKRLYTPANLYGGENSETFDIGAITISRDAETPAAANIPIAFYERPICRPDLVYLTVSAP